MMTSSLTFGEESELIPHPMLAHVGIDTGENVADVLSISAGDLDVSVEVSRHALVETGQYVKPI